MAWHLKTSLGEIYHFTARDFHRVIREANRILAEVPRETWVRIFDTKGDLWYRAVRA